MASTVHVPKKQDQKYSIKSLNLTSARSLLTNECAFRIPMKLF